MPKKRKLDAVNGVPTAPMVRSYELQHREASLLKLLNSYPTQIVRGLATRSEASWHLGRLYLIGAIDKVQYDAAAHLDKVTRNYDSMIRRYGHVQAAKLERASGSSAEDLSLSAQKKCLKAKKRYEEVYGALEECGEEVKKEVINSLRDEKTVNLDLLRRGLTVISIFVC